MWVKVDSATVQALNVSQIELNIYITCWLDPKSKIKDTEKKFEFLANSILSLAQISSKQTNLTIFTNNHQEKFERVLRPLRFKENSYVDVQQIPMEELIDIPTKLYLPWLLTWAHKRKMKIDIEKGNDFSMYLYLEDDAIFTSENLNYFLEYLPKLDSIGLIPGFLRAEWSRSAASWINPDTFAEDSATKLSNIQSETEVFFQRENPYSASILLNQELAKEYVNSDSFNQQEAWKKHKIIFDIGSTAALGLIAENIPVGYLNRVATPHNRKNSHPNPCCILRHQGDKYANDLWQLHFELFGVPPERLIRPNRTFLDQISRLRKKDRISILKKLISRT